MHSSKFFCELMQSHFATHFLGLKLVDFRGTTHISYDEIGTANDGSNCGVQHPISGQYDVTK